VVCLWAKKNVAFSYRASGSSSRLDCSWQGSDLRSSASLWRDAALDLREICPRLGSFSPSSVQGNTLLGKGGVFPGQPFVCSIASRQSSPCSQPWDKAACPGTQRLSSTAVQSAVPSWAVFPCHCWGLQLARGLRLYCHCSAETEP